MAPWFQHIRRLIQKPSAAILILILAGVIVYVNCLPNEMFWDDDDFILKNQYIQDWKFWPHFFTDNLIAGAHLVSNYWRPLLQIIFAIEWHLWADWVPGWHAVSIFFHTLAGVMLFKAFDVLLTHRTLAFLCAMIFIIHPVQTESVVYPNSMGDALAVSCMFTSLYYYTRAKRNRQRRWWWVSLALYPLALMSKETGILLVGYLALAEFFILQAAAPFFLKAWRTLKGLWAFIGIAGSYLILRATVLNFSNSFNFYNESTSFTANTGLRLASFFQTLTTYTGLLFIPHDLRVERVIQPSANFLTPDVFFGGAVFTALVYGIIRSWTKQPLISFALLWFLISILPTSNLIVVINAILYEHFLYTALIGAWLAIFLTLKNQIPVKNKPIAASILILILVIFAGRSLWRTFDWRTAVNFYEQLLLTAPHSYRVINNLGMEYAEHAQPEKAETTYKMAIALDPSNAVAFHNLGNLYKGAGRREEGIAYFEKAIALQRNFIFSYTSLAQLYLDKNDYANARRIMEQYFDYANERDYTLNVLIEIARRQNDLAGVQHYTQALLKLRGQ